MDKCRRAAEIGSRFGVEIRFVRRCRDIPTPAYGLEAVGYDGEVVYVFGGWRNRGWMLGVHEVGHYLAASEEERQMVNWGLEDMTIAASGDKEEEALRIGCALTRLYYPTLRDGIRMATWALIGSNLTAESATREKTGWAKFLDSLVEEYRDRIENERMFHGHEEVRTGSDGPEGPELCGGAVGE